MMSKRVAVVVISAVVLISGMGAALAQDPFASQIDARKAQFKVLAFNIGPLAGMAQGRMDYDADVAQLAADNLVAAASLHQDRLWPEGSDNVAQQGTTRALPSIWANIDDFQAKLEDLRTATRALQASAGEGLSGVQTGLRGVGAACSACHEDYREPQ